MPGKGTFQVREGAELGSERVAQGEDQAHKEMVVLYPIVLINNDYWVFYMFFVLMFMF